MSQGYHGIRRPGGYEDIEDLSYERWKMKDERYGESMKAGEWREEEKKIKIIKKKVWLSSITKLTTFTQHFTAFHGIISIIISFLMRSFILALSGIASVGWLVWRMELSPFHYFVLQSITFSHFHILIIRLWHMRLRLVTLSQKATFIIISHHPTIPPSHHRVVTCERRTMLTLTLLEIDPV